MLLILPCKAIAGREGFHADVRVALWVLEDCLRPDMMCMPAKKSELVPHQIDMDVLLI